MASNTRGSAGGPQVKSGERQQVHQGEIVRLPKGEVEGNYLHGLRIVATGWPSFSDTYFRTLNSVISLFSRICHAYPLVFRFYVEHEIVLVIGFFGTEGIE